MNPTNDKPMTPNPTNATPPPSESSGALNIVPGKFYRTRDGKKARVFANDGGGDYPILGALFDDQRWVPACWTISGPWMGENADDYDLIAEWIDKPEIDWSLMPEGTVAVAVGIQGVWRAYAVEPTPEHNRGWRSVGAVWILYPQHTPKWSGDWRDSLVLRPEVQP